MKAYGEAWQYSVFYCTLKPIDRVRLESALRELLNLKQDQVLIVDLGGNEDAARESAAVLGPALPEQEEGMVVI
jgi:CRISPR-associated protein Cas2